MIIDPDEISLAWPEEKITLLVRHFRDGLSCGQSGRILGKTAAAISYKRERLSLVPDLASDLRRYSMFARERAPKFKAEPPPEAASAEEVLRGGPTLASLEPGACRWPMERTFIEASAFTPFCAAPAVRDPAGRGRCYCLTHYLRAYPRPIHPVAAAVDPQELQRAA